jgi:acetyl esterase/lipase
MHAALKEKGLPCALKRYEGEQHGFRQAANIQDALQSELYFFSQHLYRPHLAVLGAGNNQVERVTAEVNRGQQTAIRERLMGLNRQHGVRLMMRVRGQW